jgi:DNA-binding response OmpR family regulator
MRILLVEDEVEAAHLISSLLSAAGFNVDWRASLAEAQADLSQSVYDLLLLDRRLPDGDGLTIVTSAREKCPGVRVIMLTAMDDLSDRVEGLEFGADDYITKPFPGPELIARVRACARRPGALSIKPIAVGALTFDMQSREAAINGQVLILHRRELSLLEALCRRVNRVVSREILLDEVFSTTDDIQEGTLDTVISRLRKKFGALDGNVTIHTVRGVGYMLTEAFD